MKERKNLLRALAALLAVMMVGVLGYMIIEGYSFIDSLYLVTVIFSTVGLSSSNLEMDPVGRLFTVFLVLVGVATASYTLSLLTNIMIEGQLRKVLGKGFMMNDISRLENHYILCGGGTSSEPIIREFKAARLPFVVIEKNESRCEELSKEETLYVNGDATKDEVLMEASIQKAKGLISNLDSDVSNLFVTLSARQLNPSLTIVTRVRSDENVEKLKRAGADKVIAPTLIGSRRMVSALLRPAVVDFLDTVMHGSDMDFQLAEFDIREGSVFAGKTLVESGIRQKSGVIVVAIKKAEKMLTNPAPNTVLETGDRLIVLGNVEQIELLFAL